MASDSVEGPSKDSISAIAFQVIMIIEYIVVGPAPLPQPSHTRGMLAQVSREEASVAFKEYHKGHFFATKPSSGWSSISLAGFLLLLMTCLTSLLSGLP